MSQLSDTSPRAAAILRIKTALIEKKMTQAELADAADCHEKTIQNLIAGRTVRDQTLFDVAMVLGLDFDELKAMWSGHRPLEEPRAEVPGRPSSHGDIAPVYMGAYTRAAVDHYIGSYLTLRPAFTKPGIIMAYRTDISWDASWPSLLFAERNRADAPYSHRGRLHVPASSQFIHLVSLTKGAMRMVMVSGLDQLGRMQGLITTVAKDGAAMRPVSAPIVYLRRDDIDDADCGEITPGSALYAPYARDLFEPVTTGLVRLIGQTGPA